MDDKIRILTEHIERRINDKTEELDKVKPSSMDALPETVFVIKEQEAAKLRAVIQEQKDILEVVNLLNNID